jgi:hypothetical protein
MTKQPKQRTKLDLARVIGGATKSMQETQLVFIRGGAENVHLYLRDNGTLETQ